MVNKYNLLTITEVCNWLNIKESHLRQLIFKQEIPYLKAGRLIRFEKESIEAWLQQKQGEQK
jgi:excisionase family DNA binding protein